MPAELFRRPGASFRSIMIKAKILIVEDEVIIARDLSQMLRKLGHTVVDSVMT